MDPDYVTVDVRLVGSERAIKLAADKAGIRLSRIKPSRDSEGVVVGYGTLTIVQKDPIMHYATISDRELSA